jgi:hypothetical protein
MATRKVLVMCSLVLGVATSVGQLMKSEKMGRVIPLAGGSAVIHRAKPGSKDNKLVVLLEAPTSHGMASDSLMVVIVSHIAKPMKTEALGPIIIRDKGAQVVASPRVGGMVEATFRFDVASDVPRSTIDTLNFLVVGRGGALLRKSVLFSFDLPSSYRLDQNYPNPFNLSTTINYQLPYPSRVSLSVYDLLGRQVKTLVDDVKEAGYHQAVFDASGLASGVYIYRVQATGNGSYHQVKRMLLLK